MHALGVFKSYMDGRSVTNTRSKQYALLQNCTIVDGLYTLEGRPAIAISSYYGSVGDVLKIKLSSGMVFEAVIGDIKQAVHVDGETQAHLVDGSVIEFIVDTSTLDSELLKAGSLNGRYEGSIEYIKRYVMED